MSDIEAPIADGAAPDSAAVDANTAIPGPRADAPAPLTTPKSIILFSDGTGNSSGKLFKTNVFRLYEALDLGQSIGGAPTQIAYYDNGVGTSSIRIIAALSGVFGFGLKRNVIDLYRFLCRNYNAGDKIFAFGFSRGAFTIRILVALIGHIGIVEYRDERELARNTSDAYRKFWDLNLPNLLRWPTRLWRKLRDAFVGQWRALRHQNFNQRGQHWPDVEFVGVWDTVAAYGGPMVELTRAIDNWFLPLTMTDYKLGDHVRCARHALALDDERDAFLPLLWNEAHEQVRANDPASSDEERALFKGRLQQVWFAGMHADVGGGYPDESLSLVSLKWMIDEIGGRLTLLPVAVDRIKTNANPYGPIHNSRQGLGSYYRYQPRKIAALFDIRVKDLQPFHETLILRDPTIGDLAARPQGLLLACNVHDSVMLRIGAGNDNYAPIGLPQKFNIIGGGITGTVKPAIDNLLNDNIAHSRANRQEALWDLVWWRRVLYFISVALVLIFIALPSIIKLFPKNAIGIFPIEFQNLINIIVDFIVKISKLYSNVVVDNYVSSFQDGAIYFFIVIALMLIANSISQTIEQTLRDRTRRLWWSAMEGNIAQFPVQTRLRRIRNHPTYQRLWQSMKWKIVPNAIGLAPILLVIVLAVTMFF